MGLGRGLAELGLGIPGGNPCQQAGCGQAAAGCGSPCRNDVDFLPERFAPEDISGAKTIAELSIIFGCQGTELEGIQGIADKGKTFATRGSGTGALALLFQDACGVG